MTASNPQPDLIHASCISLSGRAALIVGPSGSGKSSLALHLISLGAGLVADDRTILTRKGEALIASAPETITGMIEARGVGILRLEPAPAAPVHLVIDLGHKTEARLPERREYRLGDFTFPCLSAASGPHFPAAILLYLRSHLGEPT